MTTPADLRQQLQDSLGSAYAITRELGGGGMSRVFVAEETALGRTVVVKVLTPELAAGVSAERFAREVKLAARLQQANIVPVLSTGDAQGLPWYTMPFVRGESLRARLAEGRAIPLTESVGILRDVARALAYAHGEGIIHRDIKPENVLLSGGAAVVTDFGIAKALTASRTHEGVIGGGTGFTLTQAGSSIGTPAYMAPEQAAGDPGADHRTDVYAWGLLAWELLAGKHPFAGKTTIQAMVAAQMSEQPALLFTTIPGVSKGLSDLIARCLEKEPAKRPASAAEVLAALDQVVTPTEYHTGPSVPPKRGPRVLLAAALLLLLAAAFVRWTAYAPKPRMPDESGTTIPTASQSLAVLPFESVGGDTANAYFAEGIADELTTALARLPGLRLAGRSSAMRFRGKGASAQEVGNALKVGSVLEGTVRRAGGRVRVTAQLTGAKDGLVIWSDSYDREARDVFALQDEITGAIVAALRVQLAGGREQPRNSAGTDDAEAYDLYLRGMYLYRHRGAGLLKAETFLGQAIARDSGFARAHALLAIVLLAEPYYMPIRVGDVLPRARAAAERAVRLDPALSEAHQALNVVHLQAFEWGAAEAEARQGIALDPTSSDAAYRLGFLQISTGKLIAAVATLGQAKALDPLYSLAGAYLGYAQVLVGQVDAGVAEARRAVELDTAVAANRTLFIRALLTAGRTEEALAENRKVDLRTEDSGRIGYVAYNFGRCGATREARAIIARLAALPANSPRRNSALAFGYLGIGDTARALSAMERAAAGDGELLFAMVPSDEAYDRVRSSPRFAAILKRFHLDVALFTRPDGGRRQ